MQRLLNRIWQSVDFIMAILLVVMLSLVFINVVLRYGFSSGLRESVELSRLGLVWVVMLGAVIVLKRDEHLAVTEFVETYAPRYASIINRLRWLIIFICCAMLCIGGFNAMMNNWIDISPLTGLPSALFYLSGFIAGGLMSIIAAGRIINPVWLKDSQQGENQ